MFVSFIFSDLCSRYDGGVGHSNDKGELNQFAVRALEGLGLVHELEEPHQATSLRGVIKREKMDPVRCWGIR